MSNPIFYSSKDNMDVSGHSSRRRDPVMRTARFHKSVESWIVDHVHAPHTFRDPPNAFNPANRE